MAGRDGLYATIKCLFRPLDGDRHMSPDIDAVKKLLAENTVWNVVRNYIESYHKPMVSTFLPKTPYIV